MYKLLLISFLFSLSLFTSGQLYIPINQEITTLFEQHNSENLTNHLNIKPLIISELKLDSNSFLLNSLNKHQTVKPYFDSKLSSVNTSNFTAQTSIGGSFQKFLFKKVYCQFNTIGSYSKFPDYIENKIDGKKVIPHNYRYLAKTGDFYFYPTINGSITFLLHKYVKISTGVDKFSLGDGYRSLLLSDNAAAYPFLNLTVSTGRLKYFMLWNYIPDFVNNSDPSLLKEKYSVTHYLSYNFNSRYNLSFFESVIWKGQDTSATRGFELNYLNPVIFFRPVEYSIGSPDNAAMGLSTRLRLWKKTYLYGQFYLDDFLSREFMNNKGWWGTKYGYQFGLKSYKLLKIENLFFQLEHNSVVPYTYSHNTNLRNYGFFFQPLAHPLGANFRESLLILRYSKNLWMTSAKFIFTQIGADTSFLSMGSNIYKPYNYRVGDYNIKILQGELNTYGIADFKLSYFIKPEWNMSVFVGYKALIHKNPTKTKADQIISFGIATQLFNNDFDY